MADVAYIINAELYYQRISFSLYIQYVCIGFICVKKIYYQRTQIYYQRSLVPSRFIQNQWRFRKPKYIMRGASISGKLIQVVEITRFFTCLKLLVPDKRSHVRRRSHLGGKWVYVSGEHAPPASKF